VKKVEKDKQLKNGLQGSADNFEEWVDSVACFCCHQMGNLVHTIVARVG
jgi:hypothetical protein